ncbi:MAG TPA: nickel-dependent hydrogenase large subunit [Thermoanaerobaculia bacterium]|nr:nickel-dependent hydrogenase large subunit [Thermoanaerobaculia bacterium]
MSKVRTITVNALARVEGEGGLKVRVRAGKVQEVRLDIYEPPRFFEAFLKGRALGEAPDLTARVCGICPVAYQMSSVHAMEAACAADPGPQVRALRRLLYCGEWIESHVLHAAMLHAPDFLGYESALHMAKDHPGAVTLSLRLKKAGNEIVTAVGGREIHPVNVRVGGFWRAPSPSELAPLVPKLETARGEAVELLRWASGFTFPDLDLHHELVSLRHPSEYPLNEGRIVSSEGLDIAASEWEQHFEEEHVQRSNALHARRKGGGIIQTGALARYTLNFDRLPAPIQAAAQEAGLGKECRNPFKSILVRCVETLWAIDEALVILRAYEPPDPPFVDAVPREAVGAAATEAPRGLLFHRYRIGGDGLIKEARIVPPTAQNLRAMEADLRGFVQDHLDIAEDRLTLLCEQVVRNHDPCISCATHFLKLRIERD